MNLGCKHGYMSANQCQACIAEQFQMSQFPEDQRQATARLERIETMLLVLTQRTEPKKKKEPKIETIAVIPEFILISSLLCERKTRDQVQSAWLKAFPDSQWIIGEIHKAVAWETSNPTRRKNNFGAFITRWLSKAWDFRKTNPGTAVDWDKVF